MHRSLYFPITAILVVIIFIGYSVFGKQANGALRIAETTTLRAEHAEKDGHTSADRTKSSSTSAIHDDTGGAAHSINLLSPNIFL